MEIKPLKSSPAFRSNWTIRRLQPSLYAPYKARCSLAKVLEYQTWFQRLDFHGVRCSISVKMQKSGQDWLRFHKSPIWKYAQAFCWPRGFLNILWSSIKCTVDWQLSGPKTWASWQVWQTVSEQINQSSEGESESWKQRQIMKVMGGKSVGGRSGTTRLRQRNIDRPEDRHSPAHHTAPRASWSG